MTSLELVRNQDDGGSLINNLEYAKQMPGFLRGEHCHWKLIQNQHLGATVKGLSRFQAARSPTEVVHQQISATTAVACINWFNLGAHRCVARPPTTNAARRPATFSSTVKVSTSMKC
jgi:hypothetical protein